MVIKNKLMWAIALGVVAVAGASVGTLGYMYKEVEAFEKVFAKGVTVEAVDLGGLTYDEAKKMLQTKLSEAQDKKTVVLSHDDQKVEIACADLGMQSDLDEVLEVAFKTGHTGNFFERFHNARHQEELAVDLTLSETYQTELITKAVEAAKDKFYKAPVDATIKRTNGEFVTTSEKSGQALDVAHTVEAIEEALKTNGEEDVVAVTANITEVKPKYTTAFFDNSKKLIASFSTSYNDSDQGRNTNLEVATSNISDTLMPGEVFSFADHLEPVTYEAGYKDANVIVSGKIEKGIGGGICQVASTLYNAVLLTNLDVTMRQNHSLSVSYVPLGRDATYSTGSIDFKFQNNLDSAVIIESYCANNNVYVNIYSSDSAKPKYNIKFLSELVEEIPAPETKYIDDNTLEVGQQEIETSALNGKRVKLYKLLYDDNGNLVDKVLENNSYYRERAAVIRRGTKSSAQAVTQTPTATSSATPPMNEWDDSISQQ